MYEHLAQLPAQHYRVSAAIARVLFRNRVLAALLLVSTSSAFAIPPPPTKPPMLRKARMTVKVQLIEAANGSVFRITDLCKVSGTIPVYADEGHAAPAHGAEVQGCSMLKDGEKLPVSISGAKAVSTKGGTFAYAYVGIVPPDAVPGCPYLCGPQALADSRAEVRIRGSARSISFSLNPNPVSILDAKPTVWLDADVEIVD
jgi:hypothetical protein